MSATMLLNADTVREAARGRWRDIIFPALGIDVGNGKHCPCPFCGGRDRFFCDDEDGRGTWFCRQCDPQAGDGFALIKKMRACDFLEALRLVAGILGLDASTPIDHAALQRERAKIAQAQRECERRRERDGFQIDACREAERLLQSACAIDISNWSDEQLHHALNRLADAYATLETETSR